MSDILVILMALLLSTWASELKEKKNLGGEAPAWRNGELSWEAETTISLSLCASEHGPRHPAGLGTFSFGSNTGTQKLEQFWVRVQRCMQFCWLCP